MRNVAANAQALLDIDKDGALVPHGIGGHARSIITEFIAEHGRLTARIAELEKLKAVVAEYLAERDAPVPDYALRRVLVDRLRTTLEASGGE